MKEMKIKCFLCLKPIEISKLKEHEDNNEKEYNVDDDSPAHTNNFDY